MTETRAPGSAKHNKRAWRGVGAVFQAIRDFRARRMFAAMARYCQGSVLDVGGRDFFLTARQRGIRFEAWTTLEPSDDVMPNIDDARFRLVQGDGCDMVDFEDATFDTVLCVQVVEHVFEPNRMISEMARVTKPGGHVILLVPQTSMLHMSPDHFYNFTRYWSIEACNRNGLEVIELEALGGFWSSTASRFLYFFPQSLGYKSMRVANAKRPLTATLLWPVMALYALVSIPVCMLLSLGDAPDEPNNHLVVARKR